MPETPALPPLAAIIDDLAFFDDWDDRYRYLIDLGKRLPVLSPDTYTEANRVRGCASQVWLIIEPPGADDRVVIRGDSDAMIVKGLVALVLAMFSGKTAAEIAATDAHAIFRTIGLHDHLTAQRSNGLAAMVQRIKAHRQGAVPG